MSDVSDVPEQTRDERDEGWGELPEPADEVLRRQLAERPPHWEE